ncbi:hypothetical protein Brsp04_00957 [Brucella sp. NBRC 12952]|jgi:uncharacterized membrane protein|uniref:DUF1772 domain-containing protein n=2 Tax=Brucella pseudogrignonensis TaxID=419475 RepID=A0A7Y3T7K7_9HYPH|nr:MULTISPECIES: anthrone oxygenase family protein [Brucella]EMG54079.1 hypothetical protein WYI_08919 [Ochrobactrum sp. CDB2]MBK0021453.1 DUF1772 domain-containing protein [Ochrobactrum sp. S45]MBK0041809.1 DUF1772 domain-containing protein [Ochrobactrum sp. S46]QWK76936.1 DUF1772 domain-containing protein [Ochrobactrum sp. BTU1]ANG96262.1 hypothetical protein A8A54_07000 [Brucella pseudogrignonensis]
MTMSFQLLVLLTAWGSAITGGIFYAFSSFVMAALARIPANAGISAMQSINITVINGTFFAVFFGTALLCLAIIALGLMGFGSLSKWTMIGAGIYLIGTIGVTMILNVPLNDQLAVMDANAAASADVWIAYVRDWTLWNHVRTVAALVAALMLGASALIKV